MQPPAFSHAANCENFIKIYVTVRVISSLFVHCIYPGLRCFWRSRCGMLAHMRQMMGYMTTEPCVIKVHVHDNKL